MTKKEKITVRPYPLEGHKTERRILCPNCKQSRLPLDAVTECDSCGVHLEIYVEFEENKEKQ